MVKQWLELGPSEGPSTGSISMELLSLVELVRHWLKLGSFHRVICWVISMEAS